MIRAMAEYALALKRPEKEKYTRRADMKPCLLILLIFAIVGSPLAVAAQETAPTSDPAVEFLRRVEEKNQETTALKAEFDQTRVETGFMDDEPIRSKGRFWYQSPDKFHAVYESENDSEIWMIDNKLISYVPGIKQVDIIPQPTGDDAPMNQMLLGFGVKVEKIKNLFDISQSSYQVKEGEIAIRFKSKDLERTMGYAVITIYFDKEKVVPKRIVLADAAQTITVKLKDVEFNPEIDDGVFVPDWPGDVDVIDETK